MISDAIIDAMVNAGCTTQQIAAVVKAANAEALANGPSPSAERMRRYRKRREDLGMAQSFDGAKFRVSIVARDGEQCSYCSAEGRTDIDHVVPIFQGGTDDIDNLVLACRACNGKKSGRTPEEAGMSFANASAHSAHVRYIGKTAETSKPGGSSLSPFPPSFPPHPPNNPLTPKPISKNQNPRAHRLPETAEIAGPDLAYGLSKGLTQRETCDLWQRMASWAWSAAGSNAKKINWHQAFQGWVQRDAQEIIRKRAPGKPLTEHQRKQHELKDILHDLENFSAGGGRGHQENLGALRYDPGERSAAVRGGAYGDLIDISPSSRGEGS